MTTVFPSHPHRLTSSELERLLYISNSPLHEVFFNREEPNAKGLETNSNFLESRKEINLLLDENKVRQINERKLIEEVKLLNKELGYIGGTIAEKNVVPKLEKIEPDYEV